MLQEFRCPHCHSLLCKVEKDAVVEAKCRKCKAVSIYKRGSVFDKDGRMLKGWF